MKLKFVLFATLFAITSLQILCSDEQLDKQKQTSSSYYSKLERFKLDDGNMKEMKEFVSSLSNDQLVAVDYLEEFRILVKTNILKEVFSAPDDYWPSGFFTDKLRFVHLRNWRKITEVEIIRRNSDGTYTQDSNLQRDPTQQNHIHLWIDYCRRNAIGKGLGQKRHVLFLDGAKSILFLDGTSIALQRAGGQIFEEAWRAQRESGGDISHVIYIDNYDPVPRPEGDISHVFYIDKIYDPAPRPVSVRHYLS